MMMMMILLFEVILVLLVGSMSSGSDRSRRGRVSGLWCEIGRGHDDECWNAML